MSGLEGVAVLTITQPQLSACDKVIFCGQVVVGSGQPLLTAVFANDATGNSSTDKIGNISTLEVMFFILTLLSQYLFMKIVYNIIVYTQRNNNASRAVVICYGTKTI